jgi:hypothetical protein
VVAVVEAERVTQRLFRFAPPRFVVPNRVDARRTGFLHQRREFRDAIAAAQDQPAALVVQRFTERGQRMVQPPALRSTDPPVAWHVVVEDVDRDHRAFVRSGDEGGLVVEA